MKIKKKITGYRFGLIITAFLCTFLIYPLNGTANTFDNPVKCRVELDKNVLPAKSSQTVFVKVTLDAEKPQIKTDRPKVNLSIVLDRSGSMTGQKIEKAKEAAIEALRRLGSQDICSVVIYDNNVETIVPSQSARNIEWIESRIRRIRPGGNTALFGGVSQGASEIRKNLDGGYIHRIILLSDGIANIGPSSPEELGRLGAALLKEDISVTTIGVGTDYNEDLMARLSKNSDGNTYFVESSVDLPVIFTAELGDVLDVVAKKVKVNIECPDNVKPVRIIGRDGRIRGQNVELSLNQLYGGQEKYALVEVAVPEGKTGETIDIAMAEVSYINAYTQKKGLSRGRAEATFSRDIKIVERSTNIPVQKEVFLTRNAIVEEQAIALSDEGKESDAVNILQKSAQEMREFANKYNDDEMLGKAEVVEKEAKKLETEGMSNTQRKFLRSKSTQMQMQQAVPISITNEKKTDPLKKELTALRTKYTENHPHIKNLKKKIADLQTDKGNTTDKVYSKAEVDTPPKAIHMAMPRYPFKTMAKGIKGKVTVAFVVTKEGKVRDAKVVKADPEKTFDQAAIDCVSQYTFTPATRNGKPVDFKVKQTISFDFKEGDKKTLTREEIQKLQESLKINERLIIDKNGKVIIQQNAN